MRIHSSREERGIVITEHELGDEFSVLLRPHYSITAAISVCLTIEHMYSRRAYICLSNSGPFHVIPLAIPAYMAA